MERTTLLGAGLLMLGSMTAAPAMAQSMLAPETTRVLRGTLEVREYSDDRGSLRSLTIEHKLDSGDTTVVLAASAGERDAPGVEDNAFGLRGTLYEDWSETVSTRTSLFLAEESTVFAHIDVAQDLTFRVADRTTLTAGARWAEYFGDQEASFYALGARRYFSRGSLGYRLTLIQADGQDDFLAHLVSLSLTDSHGGGKTQLWLSSGDASLSHTEFDDSFAGSNRGIMLQRTQPLWGDAALVLSAGLSSYDTSFGDYTATTLGIGLQTELD